MAGVLEEFAAVFSNLPGRTRLAEHPIECGSIRPIRLQSAPYRIPHAYRKAVQQEIKEMLEGGIIEPSASERRLPYAQDQRYTGPVGKATVHIYDGPDAGLLASSGRAKGTPQDSFFHTVQIYQFKMMTFGLQETPATSQRLMDHVIREMNGFASAYLDDLIIYSNSWADHVSHLCRVLDRLVGAKLTVKLSKCMSKCPYLGHVIGSGSVEPEPSKVLVVKLFEAQKTKTQVRAFLDIRT